MTFWAIILLIVTLGLMALPLIPALMELCFPTDDQPLRVVQAHDGNIHHFANGFGHYAENKLTDAEKELPSPNVVENEIWFYTHEENALHIPEEKSISNVILSRFPLRLPADKYYESEVYSSREIHTGKGCYFRAILSKSDVYLAKDCKVLRWIHSDGTLRAENSCKLFGRASANYKIHLAENCEFERLQSARLEFGKAEKYGAEGVVLDADLVNVTELPDVHSHFERRWVMKAHFNFPENCSFDGDVVARTNVHIGRNSHINGSVKSNSNFSMGKRSSVNGSVISVDELHIGYGCKIKGPVISERSIHIASGAVIGSESMPTSISAPVITIESGAIIYGTAWATEKGQVVEQGRPSPDEVLV